jgi:hypothetical protein
MTKVNIESSTKRSTCASDRNEESRMEELGEAEDELCIHLHRQVTDVAEAY